MSKSKKPLVPKLRFPEFRDSGEWESAKIGDFIESYKGGASLTPSDFINNSHYEVIPKKAITEGMWLKMDIKNSTCCKERFYKSNLQSVVDSDYLITTLRDLVPSGPNIGYIVKYTGNKKYILAQGVYGLKPKKTIISDYLIHFSNTEKYRRMMQSVMVGSTQVHIRNSVYLNLPLIIPSLPEQQKIADCLSSLDELITTQAQKIDTLKAHKKGLMQQLFPAEGETVPGLRFPEFRAAGEWEVKKLGEKANKIGSGITPKGGDKNYRKAGRPFVRSQNVGWGCLILNNVVYIDEDTHSLFSGTEIKEDDVLLNISGASIGRSAVADKAIDGGNVNQHVCIIRTKSKNLNPFFLNQFLLSQRGQCQIDSFQAGGNRQGLNFGQIRSFSVPLPPKIDEQQKIADCLSSLDELINAEAQKIDTLKAHKKGLMQGLFPSADEVDA